MASKIGKGEWIMLYSASAGIDAFQFAIDFTGIGAAINAFADPVIGVLFLIYFQVRGVSMFSRLSRAASLLGVMGLEEITGGIAPAWIVDVWHIHRTVNKEDAEAEATKVAERQLANERYKPLYDESGIRQPRDLMDNDDPGSSSRNADLRPLVTDGIRRASNSPQSS
ncbi:MAG: hypothetical protein M1459_02790 [Patescibacteria group bacterium]|nr:hypothetical protein [Patescibacteria group bacterium]